MRVDEELGRMALNRAKAALYVEIARCMEENAAASGGQEEPAPSPADGPDGPDGASPGKPAEPGQETDPEPKPEPLPALAVMAGVNRPGPGVEALRFAESDAADFGAFLQRRMGKENVRILLGGEATAEALRKALDACKGRSRAVLYFAGYGLRSGAKAYLVPSGGRTESPDASCLSLGSLVALLEKAGVSQAALLVDAGFAGRGMRCMEAKKPPAGKGGLAFELPEGYAIYLAGGLSGEAVEAEEFSGGFFTRNLLRGFEGGADENGDGAVGFSELSGFLSRELPSMAMLFALRQKPAVLGKAEGDVLPAGEK